MSYRLEHRIHTLAQNCIDGTSASRYAFTVEDVTFSQWPAGGTNPWEHQYWLATADIKAADYMTAWRILRSKLIRFVPRIALVSQCYIEFLGQPVLIKRDDQDVAFIHWIGEDGPNGLPFMERERKALEFLLRENELPEEFFYYWNDATNCDGYASKLLLMLSAVETLVATPTESGLPCKDYDKMELILGSGVKKALWGEKGMSGDALRNRLVHGEYFDAEDGSIDYVEAIHRRVIHYLNEVVFKERLIEEETVTPQRHPSGSRSQTRAFIRALEGASLNLVNVLAEATEDIDNMTSYEVLSFDDFQPLY
ncbi:MAG: hypothetical protein NTX84_13130 [Nitrospirae bacterium]|nr:hypothetical protein [Nitrospirota bacterium]